MHAFRFSLLGFILLLDILGRPLEAKRTECDSFPLQAIGIMGANTSFSQMSDWAHRNASNPKKHGLIQKTILAWIGAQKRPLTSRKAGEIDQFLRKLSLH